MCKRKGGLRNLQNWISLQTIPGQTFNTMIQHRLKQHAESALRAKEAWLRWGESSTNQLFTMTHCVHTWKNIKDNCRGSSSSTSHMLQISTAWNRFEEKRTNEDCSAAYSLDNKIWTKRKTRNDGLGNWLSEKKNSISYTVPPIARGYWTVRFPRVENFIGYPRSCISKDSWT